MAKGGKGSRRTWNLRRAFIRALRKPFSLPRSMRQNTSSRAAVRGVRHAALPTGPGSYAGWLPPVLIGLVVLALTALLLASTTGQQAVEVGSQPFAGSIASPQVHEVITLGSSDFHPRQLAYDPSRNGLWFWTSTQDRGVKFDNRLYFYDIARGRTTSWPLYSGDWSSQLHAGLAVGPDGHVWVGWNLNLVDFQPSSGTYTRYVLSDRPTYPLPAVVLGDLPANLGVTDVEVARDGTVWIARYGALSLTSFSPATAGFREYPLPADSGDPAKLTIAPDGHIFFTTNFAANHPGHAAETIGEFDPQSRTAAVYAQGAEALALTPHGDLYTALGGHGLGLARLTATERAAARAQQRAPVFQQRVVAFDVDAVALAADGHGRIWVAVIGQPAIAVLDTGSGRIQQYQYAAPSVAANPATTHGFGMSRAQPAPGALWLRHIVAMTTDGLGHLWYIRAGSDVIEEVAA